jgi:hypothetical protein
MVNTSLQKILDAFKYVRLRRQCAPSEHDVIARHEGVVSGRGVRARGRQVWAVSLRGGRRIREAASEQPRWGGRARAAAASERRLCQSGRCVGVAGASEQPLRRSGRCAGADAVPERPLRRSGPCVGAAAASERPLRRSGPCVGAAAASERPLRRRGRCVGGAAESEGPRRSERIGANTPGGLQAC